MKLFFDELFHLHLSSQQTIIKYLDFTKKLVSIDITSEINAPQILLQRFL